MELSKAAVDIGMIVQNIDRQREFYGTLVGLKELKPWKLGDMTINRFAIGESFLKLVETGKPVTAKAKPDDMDTCGIRYLTIWTADLDACLERLASGGYVPFTGPVKALGDTRAALLHDADGNICELLG